MQLLYVFNPDEKKELDFHCDWMSVNNQYIGSVANCEFVDREDGNVFATVEFNTDEVINETEQLTIHFRINSKDWSNFDFTNDYSMGTEAMSETDRIIVLYDGNTYGVLPKQ